jgi:hypothetical protein
MAWHSEDFIPAVVTARRAVRRVARGAPSGVLIVAAVGERVNMMAR